MRFDDVYLRFAFGIVCVKRSFIKCDACKTSPTTVFISAYHHSAQFIDCENYFLLHKENGRVKVVGRLYNALLYWYITRSIRSL